MPSTFKDRFLVYRPLFENQILNNPNILDVKLEIECPIENRNRISESVYVSCEYYEDDRTLVLVTDIAPINQNQEIDFMVSYMLIDVKINIRKLKLFMFGYKTFSTKIIVSKQTEIIEMLDGIPLNTHYIIRSDKNTKIFVTKMFQNIYKVNSNIVIQN